MTTIKPLEGSKPNQPVYIKEVVQIYGPVPIKPKGTFNAADAQHALKKLVDAKKSVKSKMIAEADSIQLKKKGAFGKSSKLKALPYSSVKSFYQFTDSPGCMVVGIEGKDIPKQYVVFGMPSVDKVSRLAEVLQTGLWAPKNNLKNKVPALQVPEEEDKKEPVKDTSSSSSSSSSSSRSRSSSPQPQRSAHSPVRTMTEDTSEPLTSSEENIAAAAVATTTHSTRDSPIPPTPILRTPVRRSSTSSSSSSSSSRSSSSHAPKQPVAFAPSVSRSMSSTPNAPSISRTPTIQTPVSRSSRSPSPKPAPKPVPPPAQTKPAPPPAKAPSTEPPKQTPQKDTTHYVQYQPQNEVQPQANSSSKKPACSQPVFSNSESDSESEEIHRIRSNKRRTLVPSGGVFLIADRKSHRLRNNSIPLDSSPAEMHRSSSIYLFQAHGSSSSSSDSDSSSDDEYEVRKIRTRPNYTFTRSANSSSSSSSSDDEDERKSKRPVVYRIPIKH
ncbi:unnamed protein product [Mesocestoides corti]|uniref:Nascent polypeptide-associated complex subunit alpha, muscle-specific form-like n=1 Tax=Mesocestoides corti TaxID=53468 RepID=A0A0R3UQE0_MESCO|nr:unnamed protein product [Mesocestoides corti]